ncbi:MAG: hypothetical protein AAF627_11950 [Myxococcota bacterium]
MASRLCQFPNVEWDDDIDAISQLLSQEFLPDEEDAEAQEAADLRTQIVSHQPVALPAEYCEQKKSQWVR